LLLPCVWHFCESLDSFFFEKLTDDAAADFDLLLSPLYTIVSDSLELVDVV
jgi:hypothetical protein